MLMNVTGMEPMAPEAASRLLDDDILPLVAEANQLAGRIHPLLRESIGDLVRSMNCYYSNLIEGHDTHPRDIDRALANDFSSEPKKRDLQKEAVAHIHVQRLIDTGRDPDAWPASAAYASWLHDEFCSRLPPTRAKCRDHDQCQSTAGRECGRQLPSADRASSARTRNRSPMRDLYRADEYHDLRSGSSNSSSSIARGRQSTRAGSDECDRQADSPPQPAGGCHRRVGETPPRGPSAPCW